MKRRFKVVFNREKCKGCELCINFCAGITDQESCIGCQSCATMCPDCCISIYQLEEGES